MDTKKHILEELKGESDSLFKLKEQIKNTYPDVDYFADMQDKVLSQLKLDQYHSVGSQSDVPAHYFETLPDKVMGQIHDKKSPTVIVKFYRSWMAAAASVAVMIAAVTLMYHQQPNTNESLALQTNFNAVTKDLSSEEIEYILHNYSSDEDLELLNANDVNKAATSVGQVIDEEDFNEILSEEDLQYLNSIM